MREIWEIGVIGGIGLVFGSFLNVLIWRLNDEKAPKFWQGRSICPQCKHTLAWFDNIPLLSYLFLHGRCRYCRKKISLQYPIVELTTAVVFVFVWFLISQLGILGKFGVLGIASCFIVIFFSDLEYGLIPDEMVGAGIVLCILRYLSDLRGLSWNGATGLIAAGFFLAIFLLTRQKGLGFGDVKFAFLMGLLLGWPKILVALWFAFILGGVAAVILLALRKTKLSATIALGPFLVVGTVIAALWTKELFSLVGLP